MKMRMLQVKSEEQVTPSDDVKTFWAFYSFFMRLSFQSKL